MRLIAILAFLFAANAHANIVARVIEVKGNAFAFDSKGGSKRLVFGGRIHDMSEVMVDDSSHLSVLDDAGNEHHLSGGSYVKFYNRLLEVKNGNVWTQTKGDGQAWVNTVNAVVKSGHGQFIVSVDNQNLKSQVLTLTGETVLSSSVEPNLAIEVPAGHFSFIDQSYKSGLPRTPTRVGLRSYQKMKMVFSGVEALEKNNFEESLFGAPSKASNRSRNIASVSSSVSSSFSKAKKGKVIYIKTHSGKRTPASVSKGGKKVGAMEYYKSLKESKKNLKTKPKAKKGLHTAKVRYFGVKPGSAAKKAQPAKVKSVEIKTVKSPRIEIKPITNKEVQERAARVPASVGGANIVDDINSAFEKSLKNNLDSNKRHPEEVNQLIDELKSFKRDYSKRY